MSRPGTITSVARGGAERRAQQQSRSRAAELHLVGTGSFAVELAEWAEDAGWRVAHMIELHDESRVGEMHAKREVVSPAHLPGESHRAVIAMGGARREHWSRLQQRRW